MSREKHTEEETVTFTQSGRVNVPRHFNTESLRYNPYAQASNYHERMRARATERLEAMVGRVAIDAVDEPPMLEGIQIE